MPNLASLPMARRSLRNLFSRPATRRYPNEVRARFDGARGTVEFTLSSCVFCGLCARRCPTDALAVSREDRRFAIERLRCIACGVCVDACNKSSLRISAEPPPVRAALADPSEGRPGHQEWRGEPVVKTAGPA